MLVLAMVVVLAMAVVPALMLVLAMVVVLAMAVVLALPVVPHNMQQILKVSFKIPTHKSSVVQLQVVYKPIHKTSEFASFNHHLFHHQAHSSSEKCAHLNHPHHPHFAFVNKLHLALNLLHLFFVNVHLDHQRRHVHKLSFVVYQVYLFHHDRSSLNV